MMLITHLSTDPLLIVRHLKIVKENDLENVLLALKPLLSWILADIKAFA